MNKSTLKVSVKFTEPLLATSSGNKEIHEEFTASKSGDADKIKEEQETLPAEDLIQKASTVFHRDDKGLFVFDYCWRGHVKEVISFFIGLGEVKKLNPWNFRKAVDACVYVFPRRIYLMRDGKFIPKPDGTIQRPLRAITMQGERVALVRSEFIEAGATMEFEILVLESTNTKSAFSEITSDLVRQCLDHGELHGLGQWRTGGYGRYTYTAIEPSKAKQGESK